MPAHKIQVVWTGIPGSPYVSTFYGDVLVHADPNMFANEVLGALAQLTPELSAAIDFNIGPEAVLYNAPDTPAGVFPLNPLPTQSGVDGGDLLPRAAQGLMRWRSATYNGAREVQGRTFIPGVTTSTLGADGKPNQILINLMDTVGELIVDAGLRIASRALNQFVEVTGCSPWTEYATLRSRRD